MPRLYFMDYICKRWNKILCFILICPANSAKSLIIYSAKNPSVHAREFQQKYKICICQYHPIYTSVPAEHTLHIIRMFDELFRKQNVVFTFRFMNAHVGKHTKINKLF